MVRLLTDLVVRMVVVTATMAIVAYAVLERGGPSQGHLEAAIPLLFLLYGIVVTIHIWFCLWRYRLLDAKYSSAGP